MAEKKERKRWIRMRYLIPFCTGLSKENDEVGSDAFFELIFKDINKAVPIRAVHRKTPPTIYRVPKELKTGEEDEGYEPVTVRISLFTGSNNWTVLLEKGNGPASPPHSSLITPPPSHLYPWDNKSTVQLESYKWCCVRQLMSWHKDQPDNHVTAWLLHSCLESMKHLELKIRASYSEDIGGDSDDLALNMLLDGCFILHRLLKYARLREGSIAQDDNDDDWTQVWGRVWVWHLVATDLLLLENQIPFFVLRKLFELLSRTDVEELPRQAPSTQGHGNVAKVSCSPLFDAVCTCCSSYLGQVWPKARPNPGSAPFKEPKDALVRGSLLLFRSLCSHMLQRSASEIDYDGAHHLLHLFYLSVAGSGPALQRSLGDSDNIKHFRHQAADVLVLDLPQWIPCAKELEEAGVRFRKRKKADSFLDIEFDSHRGILKIPPLRLYDFSDQLFRNLIAFEQTYPDTRCDITTYAVFMDCLINTPEDMRILHLRGILVNQINGEQDASRFFSRICAQVRWPADGNRLKDVMDEVNNYRCSRLHKWRAALVRNYFSNPWVAMSVLAAMLLLAMTILQTTFTVYPYFNPPK